MTVLAVLESTLPSLCLSYKIRAFLRGGDLNPGEQHSRDTRDDGTVTLCTLRAATVLSRDCRADFGLPLIKKVMSHSCDGPGVMAPLLSNTNIVPLVKDQGITPWPHMVQVKRSQCQRALHMFRRYHYLTVIGSSFKIEISANI